MLDILRDRAARTLADAKVCTLATTGPAGIQASVVQCLGRKITLYVLVPDTSDHLFNLESEPEVVVSTPTWQLRGLAEIVEDETVLFSAEQSKWHTVVRITPKRLDIHPDSSMGVHAETIDFDSESVK